MFAVLLAATSLWSLGRLAGIVPDVDPGRAAQMVVLPFGEESSADSLVPNTIRRDQIRGLKDAGYFMVVPDRSQAIGLSVLGFKPLSDGQFPYSSSFGLQYRLAKPFYPLGPWGAYLAFVAAVTLCGCAMLALVCRWAAGIAGPAAMAALGLYFVASPLFLDKIASGYWLLPLFIMPSLIAAIAWPRARRSKAGLVLFFAAEALAILLKCLAGYEFLAPVAASPAIYIMVYELSCAPGDLRKALVHRWLPAALAMLGAAIAGFGAAIAFHVAQGNALAPGRGLELVLVPASYSVTGDGAGVRVHTGGMAELAIGLIKAFGLRNLHLNLAMWGALAGGLYTLRRRRGSWPAAWQALGATGQALAIALPFSLAATLSWHALAMNHALDHNHIIWFLVQILVAPVAIPLAVIAWRAAGARSQSPEGN